ncbi:MAG: flagellin lysine-N-methylase [Lachnospiraceae bacterium]|nr:flagellin lysine-N-methylase [Lachnospiraceae bacterium]
MIIRKQNDFEKFKCIADKCPKSCCIGWQIMIDESSLSKYKETKGDFEERLKKGVDYNESAFIQHNTRCSMLNDNGLCDLQSTLGEGYLCDTCRLYPRHTEEFLDLREYSLSLSCPEVVRMILSKDYEFGWIETENDECDDPDEFEDFDLLIFDALEYAREKMIEIASDKSLTLEARMQKIALLAYKLQSLYDEGEVLEMGDAVSEPVSLDEDPDEIAAGVCGGYEYCLNSLDVLIDMEALEESWTDSIKETKSYYKKHPDAYNTRDALDNLEINLEKILKSLLFTYFCGAIYDGQIYARAMIAVQSVRFIEMIYEATKEDLDSTIYLYSREVEHSDDNVNRMISFFESEL